MTRPADPEGADLVVRARRVVLPGGMAPAAVVVRAGSVAAVLARDASVPGAEVVDVPDDAVLAPGLVDTHVHVNEPGRTEWEGFCSATRAAAAGGVTTIVDMPLNSLPPTVDVEALRAKQDAARSRVHVDVGFWGGAIPGNTGHLRGLHEAGVLGFKCFLADSGVPEFPPLDDAQLADAAREVAALDALLVVHAEDADVLTQVASAAAREPVGRSYQGFLRSRPEQAETAAVSRLIGHAARTGARVHVLHLSSASALPLLAQARADGVRISAETCPHYLGLVAEQVPDGATEFKCCPPVRGAANREALWEGLAAGTIGVVVSDHSPCPPDLKHPATGDFAAAWGGVASLQNGFAVVWTEARGRGYRVSDVVGWMSAGPARLAGLSGKGRIAAGADADLVELAPDEEFDVVPSRLYQRHPVTPYAGRRLRGVVRRSWLRGRLMDGEPRGLLLERQTS